MIEGVRYETAIAALEGMEGRPDRTPLLARIEVPTLVIVGEHDTITPPEDAERIAASVPDAHLVEVPGAGHLAPMEAPDVVAEALRAVHRQLT